ncbi:MAG: helix-turn-helix domain-containing protein [Lachnospiraceae bacterium]|nr:helix-turn-helix domain-containing protein [Lachnospiraceae bacterium]
MEDKPNYYAIIPADIRYDKSLKDKAKFLYAEITALCNKDGYCFASNKYFADLYGVRKETISRLLNELKNRGYIEIKLEYDEKTKEIKRRLIYLLTKMSIPLDQTINNPIDQKVKENNTSINNTINILVDFYNRLDKFPKIKKITKQRKNKIISRLKDVGYDNLIKAFEIASKSSFLTGNAKNSKWKADFDWFIGNDTNCIKVLEGKYSDKLAEEQEKYEYI